MVFYKTWWCKGLTRFVEQIKNDLERIGIEGDGCVNRVSFRKKSYNIKTKETIKIN